MDTSIHSSLKVWSGTVHYDFEFMKIRVFFQVSLTLMVSLVT